jgi:hypothetical protein
MKTKTITLATLSVLVIAALSFPSGCKAQQAVSPQEGVALAWTQSPSCTTATPCPSYLVGRVAVASAGTACPATSGTAYSVIATVSTANATAYTDNSVSASGYYCYEVQAQQGSPLLTGPASAPSNAGVALTVTEPPLAPSAPNANETTAMVQGIPDIYAVVTGTMVASNAPLTLTARAIRR